MQAFHFGKMTQTGKAEISPYERQLIDDAIRAGMVRQMPLHASALPEYRWDGRNNQLVTVNGPTAQQVRDRSIRAANAARKIRSADRFSEVMALVDQGKTLTQIAEIRGESRTTIKAIIKRGRERLRAEGKEVKTRHDVAAERRSHISALRNEGKTVRQIAEIRGESEAGVGAVIKDMRRRAARGSK